MVNNQFKKIIQQIGFTIVFILAIIGIAASTSRYLLPHDLHDKIVLIFYGSYAVDQLPVIANHPIIEFLHRIGGFLYMLLGPLQFMPSIRNRYLKFHRVSGRVFVLLSFILGITGLVIAFLFPFSGAQETIPTVFFGIIFLYSNYKAIVYAKQRKIALHREWMIRGFSIGLGIATIRVIYLYCLYMTGWTTKEILITSFWLGWSINLLIAECWINYTRRS